MVGIVLVCHCHLASEIETVITSIVGRVDGLRTVCFEQGEPNEESMQKVAAAIREVDGGDGVLILTDMFGGTPSNLSLSFLEEKKVEVITGVNIPMLIRLITVRHNNDQLQQLAEDLKNYGQNNICIASELLKQK